MNGNYVILSVCGQKSEGLEEFFHQAMNEYGCLGIEEFSLSEQEVDKILGERAFSGGDVTEDVLDEVEKNLPTGQDNTFYLYFNEITEDVDLLLHDLFEKKIITSFQLESMPDEDWNKTWKSFYGPIEVSERIKIVPEWHLGEDFDMAVKIKPGMGFGTGTHETTYLCLCLFEKLMSSIDEKKRCLDFGCGSGILGIAAMKYKGMKCDFVDIDRPALDNCLHNLKLNLKEECLDGSSLIHRNRLNLEEKYSLVFANILENVLVKEKEIILESLSEGAYLIVSGLLRGQEENIIREYGSLKHVESVFKNDWAAILFKKEKS